MCRPVACYYIDIIGKYYQKGTHAGVPLHYTLLDCRGRPMCRSVTCYIVDIIDKYCQTWQARRFAPTIGFTLLVTLL